MKKLCPILPFVLREREKRQGFFILNNLGKKSNFAPLHLCVLALFLAVVFSACKNETPQNQTVIPTREMTDDLGKAVKLPQKIERAVSLAPNLTEIVFAVGAGEKLVGVTTFCNYPEATAKIQKVGDTLKPNIENIIALKPQIVFVSTASQLETFTQTLEKQGITVFVTNPNNLEGIYQSIQKIGEIFDAKDKADEVVNGLKKRVAAVEEKAQKDTKQKVFVQIDKSLYTIGKDSFITDLIQKAGGISATADLATAYPKLSNETALALNPDIIILSESADNNEPNEVFKNSNAVKSGKVFKINADILSRPAPRIVDALEQIAGFLQK